MTTNKPMVGPVQRRILYAAMKSGGVLPTPRSSAYQRSPSEVEYRWPPAPRDRSPRLIMVAMARLASSSFLAFDTDRALSQSMMIEPDDDARMVLSEFDRMKEWTEASTLSKVSAFLYRSHCHPSKRAEPEYIEKWIRSLKKLATSTDPSPHHMTGSPDQADQ